MRTISSTTHERFKFRALELSFNRFQILLMLAVLSFATSVQAQEKATLAWKFSTGDSFTVQFEQSQKVQTRIDARDRTLESELILGVGWNVTKVADDGTATIEQTIDRIRIKTGTPGAGIKKLVDVDTASEERLRGFSRDAIKELETLVGLKFVVVMTSAGEIVSVTPGPDVATVVGQLPETSALRRVFSGAAMGKLVSDSAFTLPGESVEQGESWSDETAIKMTANDRRTFTFDRTIKSTLKSMTDTEATIEVAVSLTQAPFTDTPAGSELTSPLELTGFTGGGQIKFDRETGTLTSSSIASEIKTLVAYREDKVKTTTNVTNRMTVTRK
ncbi:DUF6263 family protein [Mariniblastus fucicola]|nr:DUF6263 family protein [Mariniblastus fucicola]